MRKITIKKMLERTNMSPRLVRATIRQFAGWESFQECARDVVNHGIDGGFHGFVYYVDTVKFARKYMKDIIAYGEALAGDLGYGGFLDWVTKFGCFRNDNLTQDEVARAIYQGKGELADQILNAIAWFAGEEVARLYVDLVDEED